MAYELNESKVNELIETALREEEFAAYFEKLSLTFGYVFSQVLNSLSGNVKEILGSLDSKQMAELNGQQEIIEDLNNIIFSAC